MGAIMKKLLIKIALKILTHYKYPVFVIDPEMQIVVNDAAALINATELKHPTQSGEFKRHQVYAALIKQHPSTARRDIGWAIEQAIRGK
jgi:hypothetical protein